MNRQQAITGANDDQDRSMMRYTMVSPGLDEFIQLAPGSCGGNLTSVILNSYQ